MLSNCCPFEIFFLFWWKKILHKFDFTNFFRIFKITVNLPTTMKIRKLLILNFKEQINGLFHQEAGQKKILLFWSNLCCGPKISRHYFLQITGLTNKMPRLSCKEFKIIFLTQKTRKIMRIVGILTWVKLNNFGIHHSSSI